MCPRLHILLLTLLVTACVTRRGPDAAVEVCARAVEEGRLEAVSTPEGWRLRDASQGDGSPEAALRSFLVAAEGGDFKAAYRLLAAPLRARYSPELLARDFRAEPEARARLSRAREALARPSQRAGDTAAMFPVSPEAAVRMVREDTSWRVAALE
ncbi:MAG: hypothetical protein L0Y66_01140 [Myxococcaceae bacterium]|nr:hypothetical protein [Myxococcaceae bacterium]